jgi:hypothetical protein
MCTPPPVPVISVPKLPVPSATGPARRFQLNPRVQARKAHRDEGPAIDEGETRGLNADSASDGSVVHAHGSASGRARQAGQIGFDAHVDCVDRTQGVNVETIVPEVARVDEAGGSIPLQTGVERRAQVAGCGITVTVARFEHRRQLGVRCDGHLVSEHRA